MRQEQDENAPPLVPQPPPLGQLPAWLLMVNCRQCDGGALSRLLGRVAEDQQGQRQHGQQGGGGGAIGRRPWADEQTNKGGNVACP